MLSSLADMYQNRRGHMPLYIFDSMDFTMLQDLVGCNGMARKFDGLERKRS
jgi:hypothetical protein